MKSLTDVLLAHEFNSRFVFLANIFNRDLITNRNGFDSVAIVHIDRSIDPPRDGHG